MIIKKWFKDNNLKSQKFPSEIAHEIFEESYNPDIEKPENARSNNYVVVKTVYNSDGDNCQIVIQNAPIIGNSFYLLFFFNSAEELIASKIVGAVSPFPPVYEKVFGLDYRDYQMIQREINDAFKKMERPQIDIDQTKEGKFYYMVEDFEDSYKKYLAGEPYGIFSIMAEAIDENKDLK